MGGFRDWIDGQLGIQRGDGRWLGDAANIAQTLIGGSRLFDFNTRRFNNPFSLPQMPSFSNPLSGMFGPQSTRLNQWGPMRDGYQVGPNFNSGTGPGPSGIPYPQFTDWTGEAGQQPNQGQGPLRPEDPNAPPQPQQGQPPEEGRRGGIRAATPWTRAQQESQIEGARTLSALNRGRMQAREMMDRMFEGQER